MLTMRAKHKKWVIFLIIALSVYTGYRLSHFQTRQPKTQELDVKEAETIFNQANNYSKSIMNFIVSDFSSAAEQFNQLFYIDGVKKKFSNVRSNSIISVLEVSPEAVNNTDAMLREIPGLVNEKSIQTPKNLERRAMDIDSHINLNKLALSRLQERVKSPHLTTRDIAELQSQMRNMQTVIDSLSSIQTIEKDKSNILIFATIRQLPPPYRGGTVTAYINFGLYILLSLAAFTLLAVVFFYSFDLLAKLFNLIGIKSARSGSRSGGYKYGQYGYGYGYSSNRKRKKKKVYIPREDQPEDDSEPEDKEPPKPEVG